MLTIWKVTLWSTQLGFLVSCLRKEIRVMERPGLEILMYVSYLPNLQHDRERPCDTLYVYRVKVTHRRDASPC